MTRRRVVVTGLGLICPVGNNVAATNPPGGDPDPVCTTPGGCQTTHPLNPAVTVSKASNPAPPWARSATSGPDWPTCRCTPRAFLTCAR